MMKFIILQEIVNINKDGVTTEPIYVKTDSINAFKKSLYAGVVKSTQVMMKNDCIWVMDTPDDIMQKHHGDHPTQRE